MKLLLILLLLISICSCRNDSNTDYETAKYKRIDVDSTHTLLVRQDNPFDESQDQDLQGDMRNNGNYFYNNIAIGAGEYHLPVFVQTKHRKQRIDTFKKGDFILYERYDKQGEVDSIWTNKTPLFNNWDMSKAVMTFKSPFDDDTTKIESGNGEFATPSVSFTLPNAARKVFEQPQSKTDTVKGIITYYKYLSKTDIYHHYMLVQLPAIAIYDVTYGEVPEVICEGCLSDLMVHYGEIKRLSKILVNGKPFDLTKKYQFIRDDEIVK